MITIINPHAFGINIDITTNMDNYNLRNDLVNNFGWDGTSEIEVNVTVASGVLIKATSTTTPAFVADLSTGSRLTLINKGTIRGMGGAGGAGADTDDPVGGTGYAGGAGGHAISLEDVTAIIDNGSGTISGGGGGGGGEGGTNSCSRYESEGGDCDDCTFIVGTAGQAGAGGSNATTSGNGGALGQNGASGAAGSNFQWPLCRTSYAGGAGGAAGKAISLLSGGSRTIESTGTIHGATS